MVWSQDLLINSQWTDHLTFDDVQIVPGYSEIESRSTVTTETQLTVRTNMKIPIIAAPMDTVCDEDMMVEMDRLGAAGAMHRFMTIPEQVESIQCAKLRDCKRIIASVGVTGDYQLRTEESLSAGANIILIDVAHGDHVNVKRALEWMNQLETQKSFDIIAGNIATAGAALRLQDWGADALRVGIGGGSMCETRIRTGVGVPQLHAIMEVVGVANIPVIADGGVKTPGDVAKALGAGADSVMLGSMLAGTNEAPGELIRVGNGQFKNFRGSASAQQKIMTGQPVRNVEGASTMIDYKGYVSDVLTEIMDGVRSAMSYVGASTLDEFRQNAVFIRITGAGLREAHPHGVRK